MQRASGLNEGRLFTVDFKTCMGAVPATLADFSAPCSTAPARSARRGLHVHGHYAVSDVSMSLIARKPMEGALRAAWPRGSGALHAERRKRSEAVTRSSGVGLKMRRSRNNGVVLFACLTALAWTQSGCSKDHVDPFAKCPDGIIDAPSEQCDDGNLQERDNCVTDCKLPFCGDGVAHNLEDATEECDFPDFGRLGPDGLPFMVTCNTLGFDGGTLNCTATCLYDTSQCGPTFTPRPRRRRSRRR
jgi:cysteine-rich repeat protein